MKQLLSHPANLTQSYSIEYNPQITGSELIIDYIITSEQNWNTSTKFSSDYFKNWGLWDFDVFEVFVLDKSKSINSYTEYQVSPLNQTFCLEVLKPREITYTPLEKEFYSQVTLDDTTWTGQLIIPISLSGDYFVGVFSILGVNKEFFSNNPNKGLPDFHRPELFTRP
jgi:hypothetical protein